MTHPSPLCDIRKRNALALHDFKKLPCQWVHFDIVVRYAVRVWLAGYVGVLINVHFGGIPFTRFDRMHMSGELFLTGADSIQNVTSLRPSKGGPSENRAVWCVFCQ
ncbi:MAG: hypothetical protein KGZ69_07865 [Methylomonas sp.]|nr:hypothetical protein [Methylomonas sp.]